MLATKNATRLKEATMFLADKQILTIKLEEKGAKEIHLFTNPSMLVVTRLDGHQEIYMGAPFFGVTLEANPK